MFLDIKNGEYWLEKKKGTQDFYRNESETALNLSEDTKQY